MEQQPPASPLLAESPSSTNASSTPAPGHPPRKKHRWIWIILLAIFALAFFLVWRHKPAVSAEGPPGRRQQGPVTINVATVGRGQMAIKLSAIGTVTPTYTATINSQVSGQVLSVHYHEGQTVAKGTPLIDIDPRQYKAALDTALGTLARDRGVLAQAQMDLDRYQAAWARNAIAKQQLDDQAKLVDQDQGLVKSDEGAVESDQVQLAFCHITSPISGRVGLRLVDAGNIVTANSTTALVVVTQVQPITVVFTIPEDSLPQVEAAIKHAGKRNGLETAVFDRSNEHQLAMGRLMSLDNQIDTTTGTLKLRATFANRDMALYPNQFVNTRLLTSVLQNQIMVPSSTIQRNGTQSFVYKITKDPNPAPADHAAKSGGQGDDHARGAGKSQPGEAASRDNQPSMIATMVNVKVGNTDGMMTAVTGALNEGDQIADSSFEKLQNKAKVKVVKQKIGTSDEESGAP